jgi:hypothetical protein
MRAPSKTRVAELRLTPDAERALREAERLCYAMNVAIEAAEHLLSGALLVLHEAGVVGAPDPGALRAGLESIHGSGDSALTQQVMPGSAFRAALNDTARQAIAGGLTDIDARVLVWGVIQSGEINPMFYAAAGTTKEALLALAATEPSA